MQTYRADLHIHTCLSPCADLEMSPLRVVREAKRQGLHLIGICDHNTAQNVPAVLRCAAKEGISVLGGMEITSQEEVHILALFDDVDRLLSLQGIVQAHLPDTDDETIRREQVIANEDDEVLGFSTKLLIGASGIAIDRLVDLIHEHGGLAIAAHVDREAFGILGQLGFIPEGLPLDALEIRDPRHRGNIPHAGSFAFITSSDAHSPRDIGTRSTFFQMEYPRIDELRRCFRGEHGRSVRL